MYTSDILRPLISTFCHPPRWRNPRLRIQATGKICFKKFTKKPTEIYVILSNKQTFKYF